MFKMIEQSGLETQILISRWPGQLLSYLPTSNFKSTIIGWHVSDREFGIMLGRKNDDNDDQAHVVCARRYAVRSKIMKKS